MDFILFNTLRKDSDRFALILTYLSKNNVTIGNG